MLLMQQSRGFGLCFGWVWAGSRILSSSTLLGKGGKLLLNLLCAQSVQRDLLLNTVLYKQ
jgi:hypothetical protein